MPKKTQHYQLNQWEPEDDFLRTDFNGDNAKIDAALAGKAELVVGSYDGNEGKDRLISLGFTPKAVFIITDEGRVGSAASSLRVQGGLLLPGKPLLADSAVLASITEGGFTVTHASFLVSTNEKNTTYLYWALK